jgi:hypothetical protein
MPFYFGGGRLQSITGAVAQIDGSAPEKTAIFLADLSFLLGPALKMSQADQREAGNYGTRS